MEYFEFRRIFDHISFNTCLNVIDLLTSIVSTRFVCNPLICAGCSYANRKVKPLQGNTNKCWITLKGEIFPNWLFLINVKTQIIILQPGLVYTYHETIPNSTSFRLAWCCNSNSEFLLELLGFDTDCWLSRLKNPITEGASELRLEVPAANENKQMKILDWIILKVERVWNLFMQLHVMHAIMDSKMTKQNWRMIFWWSFKKYQKKFISFIIEKWDKTAKNPNTRFVW